MCHLFSDNAPSPEEKHDPESQQQILVLVIFLFSPQKFKFHSRTQIDIQPELRLGGGNKFNCDRVLYQHICDTQCQVHGD